MSANLIKMSAARSVLLDNASVLPAGAYSAIKFSTEMLEADIEKGDIGLLTHPRQARELLRLDTVERRRRVDAEAMTRGNIRGGNHSGNIADAVSDLLAMIEQGRESDEMWGAATARKYRERQQAEHPLSQAS